MEDCPYSGSYAVITSGDGAVITYISFVCGYHALIGLDLVERQSKLKPNPIQPRPASNGISVAT